MIESIIIEFVLPPYPQEKWSKQGQVMAQKGHSSEKYKGRRNTQSRSKNGQPTGMPPPLDSGQESFFHADTRQ